MPTNMFRVCVFWICMISKHHFELTEEPVCTSRFDYDFKIVEKLFEMDQKIKKAEEEIQRQHQLINRLSTVGSGSVYVRWGRNICPEHATAIYNGYIAGKKYNDNGSGSDSVFLPSDPVWSNYSDGGDGNRGYVYGTEFDEQGVNIFGYTVHQQDVQCAICKTQKSALVMIPARAKCYPGWKEEYSGYLMSAYNSHTGPHNHICVDSDPEFIPRGSNNNNEHILYLMEARCGSLPCLPYVEGRELPCVVCSA
ncbi:short-chain collagen C4-like isoform X2 [Mercenaria mercenaria]|uniref:short-chain collagen C4-like isoform X2 n=1 Tax=Mercenaria mercenaria TaxID=6596 RepID=UPI00234E4D7A|nr:short-chain collagen C4-like isoform X2 [Mercenaria mercenaria]XP_053399623.1 short-chain collagen C4-like isoform X2 [Mercenaria mercenaria]